MALVGTACGWGMAPPEPEPLALITSPLRYFSKRVYRATNHIVDGGDRFRDPRLREAQALARRAAPPNPIGYAQQFLQGTTWSSLHWGATLTTPTLVVSAARATASSRPPTACCSRARCPNSRLHTLDGEGHLMLFDAESAAYPLLEDFFAAPDLAHSTAWTSGRDITDDDEVDTALRDARGTPIVKPLAALYRGVARSDAAAAYWSRNTRL